MSTLYKYVNSILNLVLKSLKFKKYPLLLVLGLFLIGTNCNAQEVQSTLHKVSGKVIGADNGEPLPGVNIIIKGTVKGTATNNNGNFNIQAKNSDVLVFSYIGYKKQEITVGNKTTINVKLALNTITSQNIVVIGYGSAKKKDLTGSISSVNSDEIEKNASSTFTESLQGRAAGVMVTQNSGQPGGGVSIQIRGINTLSGNSEPLYVIDGVPISGYTGDQTSALSSLDPENIESIQILKDASAEAIYGSRAANGVVLITTKRGKAGETQVSYQGYVGVQQLPKTLPVMNLRQYAVYQNERYAALGWSPNPLFADPPALGYGTNWQNQLFQTAPMQNHNITLRGGTKKTQYLVSANYFDQKGIAVTSWFHRYALRVNLDNQTTDWLKLGTSLHLSQTKQRINFSSDNIIQTALRQTPDIAVYGPDGGWGGPSDPQFTLNNPLGQAQLNQNYQGQSQLIGSIYADIDFTKYLNLRQELDGTFGFTKGSQFTPTYNFGAITNSQNSASDNINDNSYWLIKTYLTFNKEVIQNLNVNAMVGHEAQKSSWDGISGSRLNFPTNNVYALNLGDASTATNGGFAGSSTMESVFGRLNLNYKDRYLITGTFRADGSSKFGPNNKWGYFPSVALAWRASNEAFFKRINQIDNLKFRLSYGLVGNQNIGNYSYGSVLGVFATQWGSGLLPTNMANPNVRWESTESYDAGVDIGILNQRIQLSADIYLKKTRNLLLAEPLPLFAGTGATGSPSAPMVNIGSLQNKGIDLSLNTINLNSKFVWKSGFIFSMNRNKVLTLSQGNKPIDQQINFFDTVTRTEVGHPVGELYGYVVEGIFQNGQDVQNSPLPAGAKIDKTAGVWVGDFKFQDRNGDGVIDEKDMTYLGNTQPLFQYGVTNNFYYKNFDLTIFVNGNYGNKIFNELRREDENTASNFNLLASASNFARVGLKDPKGSSTDINNAILLNPGTNIPRVTAGDPNNNNRVSSAYVEDGSYLRIKNVILGYTLPRKLTTQIHLTNARVYVQVQNLYTFSKYSGYDPEIGSQNQSALLSGIDYGRYPASRMYTIGISIGL